MTKSQLVNPDRLSDTGSKILQKVTNLCINIINQGLVTIKLLGNPESYPARESASS
jgi:hypothetical protein